MPRSIWIEHPNAPCHLMRGANAATSSAAMTMTALFPQNSGAEAEEIALTGALGHISPVAALVRWLRGRKQRFANSKGRFLLESSRDLPNPHSTLLELLAPILISAWLLRNPPKSSRGLTFFSLPFSTRAWMARSSGKTRRRLPRNPPSYGQHWATISHRRPNDLPQADKSAL
jgi:hypothetical protein